jgi:AcrR family transcriptional regulator
MPPSADRRPTARERRALIESAATRLFAARGYAATTVDDIVAAAGLTKPMLYRHFESKQELCVALLERYRADLIAAPLARYTPGAADRRAQLAPMIDAWLEYVEQHPDAARLLFTPIGGDPEVERVQRDLWARQRDTQTALLREFASIEDVEAEPLGEVVRAGFTAIALWWLDHPDTPRAVPASALLRLTDGVLTTLDQQRQPTRTLP